MQTLNQQALPSVKIPIILIHGTWGRGDLWADFVPALESLGLDVHTPTLRYHDLDFDEGAEKVGHLSLTDYVDDLSELLLSFSQPPIILGHSLGGLLAQLLAARHPKQHRGLILLGTAPMAGIFALYPTMIANFYQHYLQKSFWQKPLFPNKKNIQKYVMNKQSEATQNEFYEKLVPESGRVYAELAFWFLDRNKAATVDPALIDTPVLLITGTEDKIVVPMISVQTAKKYKKSTLIVLQGSDHMYFMGDFLPQTIGYIRAWLANYQLLVDELI